MEKEHVGGTEVIDSMNGLLKAMLKVQKNQISNRDPSKINALKLMSEIYHVVCRNCWKQISMKEINFTNYPITRQTLFNKQYIHGH